MRTPVKSASVLLASRIPADSLRACVAMLVGNEVHGKEVPAHTVVRRPQHIPRATTQEPQRIPKGQQGPVLRLFFHTLCHSRLTRSVKHSCPVCKFLDRLSPRNGPLPVLQRGNTRYAPSGRLTEPTAASRGLERYGLPRACLGRFMPNVAAIRRSLALCSHRAT